MEGHRSRAVNRQKCVVIGAGNVATHLALALDSVADVIEVCSRHDETASAIASKLKAARAVTNVADVSSDADFYIIAVCDDAIAQVAEDMPMVNGVVAHTSGSVPMDVLGRFSRYGVFYPLQTFSKNREIDFNDIPFFIEGSDADAHDRLTELAHGLSSRVYDADSAHRGVLHIAAVFACNYANLMWDISAQLLKRADYPFDVFRPLLKETLDKALTKTPFESQTGPAMRGDVDVIARHASQLDEHTATIYKMLAEVIMSRHNIN